MRPAQPQDMMIGRVPSSAVSDLHPALQLACPAEPIAGLQGDSAVTLQRLHCLFVMEVGSCYVQSSGSLPTRTGPGPHSRSAIS
jgi:hypothetical protein